MRPLRTGLAASCAVLAAVALAACGSKSNGGGNSGSNPPPQTNSSSSVPGTETSTTSTPVSNGKALKACMVLDTGGIDDKSFNESSYAGMTAAKKDNSKLSISYVPSNSSNDYTPNLTQEVKSNCDPVIAVGGLMATNVEKIAKANPKVHFAEVDSGPSAKNVYGLQFDTAQGAFLGGYLAAGMSKTGIVGTWGGINIPPVTIYMDGYWEGVQYYNKQNHKDVKVIGWDEKNQKGGTFANSFTDQTKGKQISESEIQQGADIIFPVAGGAGLGAGAAAQESNGQANVIWVDTDGCVSAAQYCKYFITSVTKNLAGSVQTYLDKASTGKFPTGSYVGTLANGGTGLAPYHQFAGKIPSDLQSQLDQVKKDIISGKIKITSPSQPSS